MKGGDYMTKEFRSAYKYQYLSDVIESTMNHFFFDYEIVSRCKDLQKYIETVRFESPIDTENLNFKEELYLEIYED